VTQIPSISVWEIHADPTVAYALPLAHIQGGPKK